MKIFIPKIYQKDIFSINYKKLKKQGIKLLVFDLDNTIGKNCEKVCNKKTSDLINKLVNNFQIVVASNNNTKRVNKFCQTLNCDAFSWCFKPTSIGIKKIKNKYKISYSKMAIIGDQIVTDIFIGNRLGILTILVDPISEVDFKITGLNRKLEKVINKKNGLKRGNYYEKE